MKLSRTLFSAFTVLLLCVIALTITAGAIEESEVEAAVNATSKETVSGNVLIWFFCAVGFLKVSQKIDSFLSSLGVNVGHTGGSMLAEAMIAARGVSMAAGLGGKIIGFGRGSAGKSGGSGPSAGDSGFLRGGLAGVISRKITSDAAKTAASTTERVAETPPTGRSGETIRTHTSGPMGTEASPAPTQPPGADTQAVPSDHTAAHVQTATDGHSDTHVQTVAGDRSDTHVQTVSADHSAAETHIISADHTAAETQTVSADRSATDVQTVSADHTADHTQALSREHGASHVQTVKADHTAAESQALTETHSVSDAQTLLTDRSPAEAQVISAEQSAAGVHTVMTDRANAPSAGSRQSPTVRADHTTVQNTGVSSSAQTNHKTVQHNTSLGGKLFFHSMQSGGAFASQVIGRVATGGIRSDGTISGPFAAQALSCYTGLTAQGDAAPEIRYADVEMGGGRITGTEYSPEYPQGIPFGMYHTQQYTRPQGPHQRITTADGAGWYKEYGADTVSSTPYQAPDGEISSQKTIVKRLPDPPKRKDRL